MYRQTDTEPDTRWKSGWYLCGVRAGAGEQDLKRGGMEWLEPAKVVRAERSALRLCLTARSVAVLRLQHLWNIALARRASLGLLGYLVT